MGGATQVRRGGCWGLGDLIHDRGALGGSCLPSRCSTFNLSGATPRSLCHHKTFDQQKSGMYYHRSYNTSSHYCCRACSRENGREASETTYILFLVSCFHLGYLGIPFNLHYPNSVSLPIFFITVMSTFLAHTNQLNITIIPRLPIIGVVLP